MTRIHSTDFWAAPERATLEKHLVDRCREIAVAMAAYLEVIGQRNAKHSGTTSGAPDAILYCAGHVHVIEFKRAKDGRLSVVQEATIRRRAEQGIETSIIRDEGEFIALINSCRR